MLFASLFFLCALTTSILFLHYVEPTAEEEVR
jgi:hypothetical protein